MFERDPETLEGYPRSVEHLEHDDRYFYGVNGKDLSVGSQMWHAFEKERLRREFLNEYIEAVYADQGGTDEDPVVAEVKRLHQLKFKNR